MRSDRAFPCGCVACSTRRERAFEATVAALHMRSLVIELNPDDEDEEDDLGAMAQNLLAEAEAALEQANEEFEDFADQRESGELPFDKDELLLAALLALLMLRSGSRVVSSLRDAMRGGVDARTIERVLTQATPEMRQTFATIQDEVTAIITRVVGTGVAQIKDGAVTARVQNRTIEAIVDSVRYFTNDYFERHVIPAVMARVEAYQQTPDPTDLERGLDDIYALLDTRFRNVPYWRMLANLAASRAYHYSLLHSAQSRGLRGYRFVAVLDERTTQLCRSLNGREFWIADAIAAMDRVFDNDDPEAARVYLPWVNARDIEGLGSADLASMGVLVPPLHPHCRSTIQPIY